MTVDTFAFVEDATGIVNERPFSTTLPTLEVFERLVGILDEAFTAKRTWETAEGRLTRQQEAYECGATDGLGCLIKAIEAVQALARDRATAEGRLAFKLP